mmetsp:Transcript_27759/g.50718  ORF Transcript_27759/g.50718 Transcript_27759/m.50718 type:complete len:224 (+) Transcript_27759:1375-2046(+)
MLLLIHLVEGRIQPGVSPVALQAGSSPSLLHLPVGPGRQDGRIWRDCDHGWIHPLLCCSNIDKSRIFSAERAWAVGRLEPISDTIHKLWSWEGSAPGPRVIALVAARPLIRFQPVHRVFTAVGWNSPAVRACHVLQGKARRTTAAAEVSWHTAEVCKRTCLRLIKVHEGVLYWNLHCRLRWLVFNILIMAALSKLRQHIGTEGFLVTSAEIHHVAIHRHTRVS